MKTLLLLFLVSIQFVGFGQTDEELVKQVVTSAYINGVQNGGPVADIRKGFHPSFNMLRFIDNDVKPLPIEEWITNMEKARVQNNTPVGRAEGKFISVTVAGTSANVVLELWRDGKRTFTDHLLLYKFAEGWRIVSKAYYRYP
ncbi:MAG: nuclear transport factor 2 family protein [Bacteroidota bacterium]